VNVDPRCPSPTCPNPHGLWSLWDMMSEWGYIYFSIGAELAYLEAELENHRTITRGAIAGHGTSTLDPNHPVADNLISRCDTITRLAPARQELDVVTTNAQILKAKILTSRRQKPHHLEIYTNDVLDDVHRIKNDLTIILSKRLFYFLRPDLSEFYAQPELFGEHVAKKFPAARDDIESAGNCLALGESTACVLHLNRVVEIAIHRLATRLNIAPDAKDNMGSMLGKMTDPIKNLPDKTEKQKRKKEQWAECRTNLYHVKMAWRDPSSHGKQSYDEKKAADIFRRVKDFMQQLATL
jgi:hypothetical protein